MRRSGILSCQVGVDLPVSGRPMTRNFLKFATAAKWLAVLVAMAAIVGSVSAFFLGALDAVTRVRFASPWLLFFLPLAGLLIGWVDRNFGKSVRGGNNLLIDEIHQAGAGVPRRRSDPALSATASPIAATSVVASVTIKETDTSSSSASSRPLSWCSSPCPA